MLPLRSMGDRHDTCARFTAPENALRSNMHDRYFAFADSDDEIRLASSVQAASSPYFRRRRDKKSLQHDYKKNSEFLSR